MVTEQKITGRLPWYCKSAPSQIYELGDERVVVRRNHYYISTTSRGIRESAFDFPYILGINALAGEDTIEIWGSGSKHLRPTEKKIPERMIEKEIDVDNVVAAMNATDEEVNQWLGLLLEDYDVDSTVENIESSSSLIRLWLEQQALKSGLKLKEDELSKLFRFAVRLAYEALYVGSI